MKVEQIKRTVAVTLDQAEIDALTDEYFSLFDLTTAARVGLPYITDLVGLFIQHPDD